MVAEDDDVEFEAVVRFLVKNGYRNPVRRALDGVECYEALMGTDEVPKIDGPCVTLMDINMPRMNGLEFLKVIKADEVLKVVPVVVLTTSNNQQDKLESYKNSVAGYMVKPIRMKDYLEIINTVKSYWQNSQISH